MIAPVKLWIHQVSPTEYTYGITFKLIKVLVKLPLTRALKNQDDCLADFLDSDSDWICVVIKVKINTKPIPPPPLARSPKF